MVIVFIDAVIAASRTCAAQRNPDEPTLDWRYFAQVGSLVIDLYMRFYLIEIVLLLIDFAFDLFPGEKATCMSFFSLLGCWKAFL